MLILLAPYTLKSVVTGWLLTWYTAISFLFLSILRRRVSRGFPQSLRSLNNIIRNVDSSHRFSPNIEHLKNSKTDICTNKHTHSPFMVPFSLCHGITAFQIQQYSLSCEKDQNDRSQQRLRDTVFSMQISFKIYHNQSLAVQNFKWSVCLRKIPIRLYNYIKFCT